MFNTWPYTQNPPRPLSDFEHRGHCKKVFHYLYCKLPRTVPFHCLDITTRTYATQLRFVATIFTQSFRDCPQQFHISHELPHNARNTLTHGRAFSHSRNLGCYARMITHFRPSHSFTQHHSALRAGLAPSLYKLSQRNRATLRNRAQQVIFTRCTLFSRSQIYLSHRHEY